MALTRSTGNSNGEANDDACQRSTPGRAVSTKLPGRKLPSVRCKTAGGAAAAGWSAALAARGVTPAAMIDRSRTEDKIPLKT
jgi:hypothetical protein